MKRFDNTIFVILIFCLLICGFFWSQLSWYKPSQIELAETTPQNNATKLSNPPTSQSISNLPRGRNVFKLLRKEEVDSDEVVETTTLQKPRLSTICLSDGFSLAIINGEILAKDDVDSKSQFRVETIKKDKVRIRFIKDRRCLWLKLEQEQLVYF